MLRYTSHKLEARCARCCISKGQKHDIFGLITISGRISSLHSFVPSTCFSRVLYSREHSVNYNTNTASFKYSSDTKPTALSFSCFQQEVKSCWLLDQAFYLRVKANTSLLPLNSSTDPSSLRRAERLWKERRVFCSLEHTNIPASYLLVCSTVNLPNRLHSRCSPSTAWPFKQIYPFKPWNSAR